MAVVITVCSIYKLQKFLAVVFHFTNADNINRNIILLQLLSNLHKLLLGFKYGSTDESNNALSTVLVLPVLQRQLGDLHGGGQVALSTDRNAGKRG